jgi:dicarboxylate transporter 10
MMIQSGYFADTPTTHFLSSIAAVCNYLFVICRTFLFQAGIATTITQPLDVMKTRMMNAKPGEFSGILDCTTKIAKTGPMSFFKVWSCVHVY